MRNSQERNAVVSLYAIVACALVALVCLAVISRNWSCRTPRPPVQRGYSVVGAVNGAVLSVKAGPLGRRTASVVLSGISAPDDGSTFSEPSRENLERLAGSTIRVETERHGLFRGTANDSLRRQEETPPATAEAPEARSPIVGIVYGESGACLNQAQVAAGWALCLPEAPRDWRKQEAAAQKQKLGMWSKP